MSDKLWKWHQGTQRRIPGETPGGADTEGGRRETAREAGMMRAEGKWKIIR